MLTLYYLMKKSKKKTIKSDNCYSDTKLENVSRRNKDRELKCRTCLNNGSVPIYGQENTSDIVNCLQVLAEIQLSKDDDLPKHLCTVCYKLITAAILFRKTAKQSEDVLKQNVKEEIGYDQTEEYADTSNYDNLESPPKCTNEDNTVNAEDCERIDGVKREKTEKDEYSTKVTCNICNKVINKSYFKEHVTMHDPDHKKYVCDVCGKSFRLQCSYRNHSLRHGSDFPYKCQFCPYKARYVELLKTHLRTHTGDYRYMCTECPARFLFKSNLNSHMMKHKEPQFNCDACKRAFHTKLLLKRHFEANHLGIKNHVCDVCGKAFGNRNALMKHQRNVHKREKLLYGRMPSYLLAKQTENNPNS